jgi:hypothetical protein
VITWVDVVNCEPQAATVPPATQTQILAHAPIELVAESWEGKIEASASGVLEIEKFFKISPVVLRYLLIKTVRENTMTAPKAPSYRKSEVPVAGAPEGVKEEKKEVSETELDKAIDAVIAE